MTIGAAIAPREIADGVYWIGGCFEAVGGGGAIHYHVSAYLVIGEQRTALFDTGDPAHWDAIAGQLETLLGDRTLDYVVPSHPELPHAGNLVALVQRYPEVEICGDVRDYHVYYPETEPHLVRRYAGEALDLGGRRLELLPSLVYDLPNTLWAYDTKGGVLFVSDGFAYIHGGRFGSDPDEEPSHLPGQCQLVSGELGDGPTVDQAAYGTGRALYWTRFVDISDTFEQLEQLLASHPTNVIAPCHGNVISDPERVVPVSIAAHRLVYEG